jgi:hypothetical protein
MSDMSLPALTPEGLEALNNLTGEMFDKVGFREGILALQNFMLTLPDKMDIDEDFPLRHHFAPGCYGREILLPKGSLIIGKIHKHAHLNIISKGSVMVATEFGPASFSAPHTFVSQPGTKRAVYALEDTVWTTIHVTQETDLEKIEDYVIAKSYEELEAFLALSNTKQIEEKQS